MLYTMLPGLTMCMTLLKGNHSNVPVKNVAFDSDQIGDAVHYTKYLDAAMVLIQAAKQMKIREGVLSTEEELDESESAEDNFQEATEPSIEDTGDPDFPDQQLRCPSQPIDCEELIVACGFTKSGVYRIWPRSRVDTSGDAGFDIYCDMDTDGGGWTVFQRRDDFGTNSDFFYQNWLSYKYGFGHIDFDFWLGNDKIFALSNQRRSMLRIELLDFGNEEGYATYDNFYLDDENEGYRLHIGYYRGNIGDSFRGHNLCKFSTRDRDNDRNIGRNCAQIYKGGWWYNNCHTANLNGLYLKGDHDTYANGVNWHGWRGFRYSLKRTEMKLRSSNFRRFFQSENNSQSEIPTV